MSIFKRKKRNTIDVQEQSQYEQRQPNHWAFDDDPLLNIEPVFENSPEAEANSRAMGNTNQQRQNINQNQQNQSFNNRSNSPLSGIINEAIQKSDNLRQEIIENDPVIAKLNKIEELRANGKVDESVFTDLSKSSNVKSYSQKANEFTQKHIDNKISNRVNESAIDRARRLEEKARKLRDGSIIENTEQNIAVNNTMIQRRIRNNQNAFAINLDKKQFYIQNTNLERAKAAQAERRSKENAQSLNPVLQNKQITNDINIKDNKMSNFQNSPYVEVDINRNKLISEKFDNEINILEQELFSALQKWQQYQISKINKMISNKVNQINNKTFDSEEQKIKYLKNKIKHLNNSINKGKINN